MRLLVVNFTRTVDVDLCNYVTCGQIALHKSFYRVPCDWHFYAGRKFV